MALILDGNSGLRFPDSSIQSTAADFQPIAHLIDERPQGTGYGTTVINTWTTRVINTVVYDLVGAVTLVNNEFTANTDLWMDFSLFTLLNTGGRYRVYSVTANAVWHRGLSMNSSVSTSQFFYHDSCRLEEGVTYRIEYYFANNTSNNGVAQNVTSAGTERYSRLYFRKFG